MPSGLVAEGGSHTRASPPGQSPRQNHGQYAWRRRRRAFRNQACLLGRVAHALEHGQRCVTITGRGRREIRPIVLHGWRSPPAFQTGAPELHDLRATLTGRPTSCAGASMPYGPPDTLGNQRSRSPWQTGSTPVMRRLGQAASRSQVLRCQGCSGVEKAILATTTP